MKTYIRDAQEKKVRMQAGLSCDKKLNDAALRHAYNQKPLLRDAEQLFRWLLLLSFASCTGGIASIPFHQMGVFRWCSSKVLKILFSHCSTGVSYLKICNVSGTDSEDLLM